MLLLAGYTFRFDRPGGNSNHGVAVPNVLRHHASGAGNGFRFNIKRSNQNRVTADEHIVSDLGTILFDSIIVGSNTSRTDIATLTDPRVTQITNVTALGIRRHRGVFEFNKIAD